MKDLIFLHNGFIHSNFKKDKISTIDKFNAEVITFVTNLMHFGFVPNKELFNHLNSLSKEELSTLWIKLKPSFEKITGSDRSMDSFVVYKNFPEEVLNMTDLEYWSKQIFIYLGFDSNLFSENENKRNKIKENKNLKVLSLAKDNTMEKIFNSLIENKSRWSDNQKTFAEFLINEFKKSYSTSISIKLSSFGFKENGINIIKNIINNKLDINFIINDATDILRLAASLSDSDCSLRFPVKFRNFKRSERRLLLSILDNTKNIEEDFSSRKEMWKRLLSKLHPNDYKFKNVSKAYDSLYNNNCKTFDSKVAKLIHKIKPVICGTSNKKEDASLKLKDNLSPEQLAAFDRFILNFEDKDKKNPLSHDSIEVWKELFSIIAPRAGYFLRNFHHFYEVFGSIIIQDFIKILKNLETIQLVKFEKYLLTINSRKELMFAPKGNWSRTQIVENKKCKILKKDINKINKEISNILASRLESIFPEGVLLDDKTSNIKLQTNDQELAEYGRGTVFDIPKNITFIRTASFWEMHSCGNIWFDNGWNFFDENFKALGSCCWYQNSFPRVPYHKKNNKAGAIFSGDPSNIQDHKGRACQMIDLYIDKLKDQGVRYALWNILSYNNLPFNNAKDVLGTLQLGENPMEGNLYEPSRAEMIFPITGESKTKYLAMIDIIEMKIIFFDANLKGSVNSAESNGKKLQDTIPAYLEYLDSLPSVYDLVKHAKSGKTPVLFSDNDFDILEDTNAYVFKKENENNVFVPIDINHFLN